MAELADLSVTDANNVGRFPEGQGIPTLNNGARALEGILARANRDRSGYTLTTGSASAYAILTQAAYPAHASGMIFLIRAHVANTGAATITINSLDAKPLVRNGGAPLLDGDIAVNQMLLVAYNTASDSYECIGVGCGEPASDTWVMPTGTASRASFATGSVNLPTLAGVVMALIEDLVAKGIIAEAD
jgi:hypothetical protein